MMAEKQLWIKEELTCKPLDTYEEIFSFLQDPPPWRTLCKELIPHSEKAIRNINVNKCPGEIILENPQTFCHIAPDTENVKVKRDDRRILPKTLVCHDMANGYHDDSVIEGTGNYDAYTFYNWAGIDTFVYFSHHLVTIPPLGWINVAHQHGVQVLGTLITEWGPGAALWERVLGDEAEWRRLASALVAIAKTLNFDGWLLNIENKVPAAGELVRFVGALHAALHAELPAPLLLWYDSVTADGHLAWQNALNQHNRAFFDACDGIFTNYSWREEDVASSVAAAGARRCDVYVGIDVWGRNFYGGGQFNTQQAVQLAHRHGCSLAVFAPAWTHEAMPEPPPARHDLFLLRDRAFWNSLWPFLNTHLPCRLPFQTSFCRGQGKKRRLYGEVIGPVPWYNLGHMQYQANSSHGPHGYLLSTADNVAALARLGLLRNSEGVRKYRQTVDDYAANHDEGTGTDVILHLEPDSVDDIQEESVQETIEETDSSGKRSVKRKITRVLRYFFKSKFIKTENNSSPQEETTGAPEDEGEAPGHSGLEASVNLRLGKQAAKTQYALVAVAGERQCLEPYYEDSFVGGSCLKVNPCDEVCRDRRLIRIFFSDFQFEDILIACVVTKALHAHEDQFLNILLQMESHEGDSEVTLAGRSDDGQGGEGGEGAAAGAWYPASGSALRRVQTYLLLNESAFYVPLENSYNWDVRYYCGHVGRTRVREVRGRVVGAGGEAGAVLLGHFGLCRGPSDLLSSNTPTL